MDESAATEISTFMEAWPYKVDSVDAVPMRRPRFCWCSEEVRGVFMDVGVEQKRYWWEVSARADYPALEQWITPGYTWEGYSTGTVLPTCLKSIPPPEKPAGVEKCDESTRRTGARIHIDLHLTSIIRSSYLLPLQLGDW